MDRQPPRTTSDEIELYIRTYYSLLRSSGEVRVRAFEEAHLYSNSSLHLGAREPVPDVAAFGYSAGRLPACMPVVRRIVLGQSHEQFEAAGLRVQDWGHVRTRGRRRPLRWDGDETLAAFVTSTSDIDDLVPIVTAWQIEWNKIHRRLADSPLGRAIAGGDGTTEIDPAALSAVLGLDAEGVATLQAALGESFPAGILEMARRECDLSLRLLNGSYAEYQRAAQRWWSGIAPSYVREERPRRRPVYFVSSNPHALVNLLGGYARGNLDEIRRFIRERNLEDLAPALEDALARGDEDEVSNITYYAMRPFVHAIDGRIRDVQRYEAERGIVTLESPGRIDVGAQLVDLAQLRADQLDPRVRVPGVERLADSEALILNIEYPLGMAAYHHLSRVAQGVGEIRGVYVMGKAATLNARVGDVMIPKVAHDEHSQSTYLFRNCFVAADVQRWLRTGTVLDNQKALTVRSAFLQNREYMSVFYREGYTILEMEAGPYLSAIYELVYPTRHPNDEIVHLSDLTPFDVGILHYASDTPYSRRHSLLSKSLSYFGVDATYACASAILRRIFTQELARIT